LDIKDRIKILRKKHLNLTQDEFAPKINISRSNLGNIESGRVNLTDRVITDICTVFSISEDWLRTGEGEMFTKLTREDEIVIWASKLTRNNSNNEFAKNFARVLSRLDESEWEFLEKMARKMVEDDKKG
jgi:DNA-binding XRE family transcriptional regulator